MERSGAEWYILWSRACRYEVYEVVLRTQAARLFDTNDWIEVTGCWRLTGLAKAAAKFAM